MSGAVDPRGAIAERYVLERELGRGGMGVVFQARDLRHDRTVALKLLPPELSGGLRASRFEREIRTLAQLSHPHILPLHDSGITDGSLFYVMPHVVGESLRDRLVRDGALPVADALRLARQLADALAYAHAHGVVHRDIKPENVLLDRHGNAWLADFGIAHVVEASADSKLTTASVRPGSPAYMSPEQIAGDDGLDGRSDLYSLGCVLFEMIAGEPPFTASSAAAVLRAHMIADPPSLRARRADVAPEIDQLVSSLLAKAPENRTASAAGLRDAIDRGLGRLTAEHPTHARQRPPLRARPLLLGAAAVAVVAALGWWAASADLSLVPFGGATPDPARILVLPLQWQGAEPTEAERESDALLHAAFARWTDLDLAPAARSAELGAAGMAERLDPARARTLARRADAGRFVYGIASRVGDSLRVELALHETAGERRTLRRAGLALAPDAGAAAFALLADSLLFGRVTWDGRREADIGTRSAAARAAYGAAHEALDHWDLARADTLLASAVAEDEGFARARFWLGQVRNWAGSARDTWRVHAARAARDAAALTERERALALALELLASAQYPEACALYEEIRGRDAADFAAGFGLGECRRLDRAVLRDPRSPSGFRFRASPHGAAAAYSTAFRTAPASHRIFRSTGFERLHGLLWTKPMVLTGTGPGGAPFLGEMDWADSLAIVPYPWDSPVAPPAARVERALAHQRSMFRDIAATWAAAYPRSSEALHAHALSLEMLGDPDALQSLLRARSLAGTDSERFRLTVREVWVRIKHGTPDRLDELRAAAAIADSLLYHTTATSETAGDLAALASLLGRPAIAARLARTDAAQTSGGFPAALVSRAEALLAFAIAGGPLDSIAALERETASTIREVLTPEERAEARGMYLERAAFLAFPAHRSPILGADDLRAPLAVATALLARGDSANARARLQRYAAARGEMPASAVTLDVLYPEAQLWRMLGRPDAARAALLPTFDVLEWVQPEMLEDVGRAGSLVRGLALMAELEAENGSPDQARRWAQAALVFWSDGEAAVAPVVRSLERIASLTGP